MKKNKVSDKIRHFACLIGVVVLMQSCYSVRIASSNGVPEKKPVPSEAGFYRDKLVYEKDTTITLNVVQTDFTLYDKICPDGFYSVEYRVSLGNALLNMITFGKVKRVKIKYVCTKN